MAYIFVLECRIKKKEFCKLYLRTMKSAAQYNFKYTNVLGKLKEKNEIYSILKRSKVYFGLEATSNMD